MDRIRIERYMFIANASYSEFFMIVPGLPSRTDPAVANAVSTVIVAHEHRPIYNRDRPHNVRVPGTDDDESLTYVNTLRYRQEK